ncbi:MAG: c-type cytochrome [Gammaproteobacteria bacterium]|nr:c-type cytochrome [Gammaproteobacteria bacterium]
MKRLPFRALAVLLLGAVNVASAADGDPARGATAFETCRGCHAVAGYFNVYPSYQVPKLGGQNAAYVSTALKEYRDGARKHDTMHANAMGLTDQQIADIAAYVSQYE